MFIQYYFNKNKFQKIKMKKIAIILGTALLLFSNQVTSQESVTNRNVRLSVELGYGYRLGKIAENTLAEVEDHIRKLKPGFNIEAHSDYFIGPQWGLGIAFSNFLSGNTTNFKTPVLLNGFPVFSLSEEITITYIGPEVVFRSVSANEKHSFTSHFSIGYMKYKNNLKINGFASAIDGTTLGLGLGARYDYHITPVVAIGASVNMIGGTLSEVTDSLGDFSETRKLSDEEKESLSRVGINAGVRFYL